MGIVSVVLMCPFPRVLIHGMFIPRIRRNPPNIHRHHPQDLHPWFTSATEFGTESPYFDYYIWSETQDTYSQARIIFKGLCTSNWEYNTRLGLYYFHRFFPFQPDLNFRNPRVLLEVCVCGVHGCV